MIPLHATLLELVRLVGLLARSITESSHADFISLLFEIRKVCDTAIQRHTFRVIDPGDTSQDDEL